jgi:hypothetical protein
MFKVLESSILPGARKLHSQLLSSAALGTTSALWHSTALDLHPVSTIEAINLDESVDNGQGVLKTHLHRDGWELPEYLDHRVTTILG